MVLWFGRLFKKAEFPDSVFVFAYLGEVSDFDQRKFTPTWEYRKVELPIGDLTLLHIGAVLKDGFLIPWDHLPLTYRKTAKFTIDVTKSNAYAFHRKDGDENGPHFKFANKWPFYDEPDADAYLLGFQRNDDRFGIIIPCVEIMRFFYCYSSNIARIMTSDKVLRPEKYLYDVKKSSFDEEAKLVKLKPRIHTTPASAIFLANFFTGQFLIDRAQLISKQAAIVSPEERMRPFVAFPPFDGHCQMRVSCYTDHSRGSLRIVVTKILSVDVKSNFKRLLIEKRSNDKKETPGNGPPSGFTRVLVRKRSSAPITINPGAVNVNLGIEESINDELSARFPDLLRVMRVHNKKNRPRSPSGKGKGKAKRPKPDCSDGSTISSSSKFSNTHRVEILPDVDNNAMEDARIGMQRIIDSLILMDSTGIATVKFLSLTREIQDKEGVIYNLPHRGHKEAWAFLTRHRNLRRRFVVASITKDAVCRYLIEFEQRYEGECSTLILWSNDGLIENEQILVAVEACVVAASACIRTPMYLYSWGRLRHSPKKNENEEVGRFFERILTARAFVEM